MSSSSPSKFLLPYLNLRLWANSVEYALQSNMSTRFCEKLRMIIKKSGPTESGRSIALVQLASELGDEFTQVGGHLRDFLDISVRFPDTHEHLLRQIIDLRDGGVDLVRGR